MFSFPASWWLKALTQVLQSRAMDEQAFRRHADAAIESLKQSLIEAEGDADFEVEDQSGALHISFEEPPGRFVISQNAPVRQIWISALSTSFKLDWNDDLNDFVLAKTGEELKPLVSRLMNQQLESEAIDLD
jgi:CyaY protein